VAKKKVVVVPTVEPRLLDIKAAAEYLSCKIWFLRTLVWEKQIAHLRLGHRLVFDKKDLDRFVENQKVAVR